MASGREISPGGGSQDQETPKVQRFQVNHRRSSTTMASTSKVKEYIARVKKADEESRKNVIKPEAMLTLEELYETDENNLKKTMGSNPDLSQTLRALKEKDILISKLRQSCSDLAIKYASAENTIDQLRFGVRRLPRRASSGSVALQQVTRKDVCVETEVLEEPCVDWLEKVQNWRADVTFNPSHEDSCGDSGFRGSELELSRFPSNTLNHPHIGTQTVTLNGVINNSSSAQDYLLRVNDSGILNDTMNSVTLSESHQILSGPSTSKTARTLDTLLDDATILAKRVKEKSMRLAEILKES